MKFAAISDVHIKRAGDPAEVLLLAFLRNPDVQSSDVIFLLGDIFDLMIGPHTQYFVRYQAYFDEIKKLIKEYATLVFDEIPVDGVDGVSLNISVPGKKSKVIVNTNIPKTRQLFP